MLLSYTTEYFNPKVGLGQYLQNRILTFDCFDKKINMVVFGRWLLFALFVNVFDANSLKDSVGDDKNFQKPSSYRKQTPRSLRMPNTQGRTKNTDQIIQEKRI